GGCIRRCRGHAAADCMPPDGAGVARCLARARTRALRTVLGAACRRDCPACYGGFGPEGASGGGGYSSRPLTTLASIVPRAPARRIAWRATGRARGGRVRPPLRTLLRSLPRRRLRRCWPGRRAGHGVRRPGGVPCGQPDRRGMRDTARVPRRTLGRGLG